MRKQNHCDARETGCTRTQGRKHGWWLWALPIGGMISLVWFLVRVIPKPSRASYPCQKAAMPLAAGFIAWLVAALASLTALRKARSLARSRWPLAMGCLAAGVVLGVLALWNLPQPSAMGAIAPKHAPIGEGKGVYPGRVVWVHDPDATEWEGPGKGHWWEANHTSHERVGQMLSMSIRQLSGQENDAAAWDKLLRHYNKTHGRGDRGYRPGEKIAIKVNFVGMIWRENRVNPDTYTIKRGMDYMNTSPQLIMAVMRQLVGVVGVKQSDISLVDTLAYIVNEYYDIMHGAFPDVQYVDFEGKFGRIKAKESQVPFYWSCRPKDCKQDCLPSCFAEADYLINIANLKAHGGAGVTLCAKNHCGSFIRWPVQAGYYDMHPSCFSKEGGVYRVLVDFTGHAHLGGKTLLYLIDGLYSGKHPMDFEPRRWNSAPFNGDWTSSLLASQDPVAVDSVGVDFLQAEWDKEPCMPGTEDYLHEAALANNPPSGTFYDPNHPENVERLPSLGVHEHWNSPVEKQYSRNLRTGQGIELIAIERGKRADAATPPK